MGDRPPQALLDQLSSLSEYSSAKRAKAIGAILPLVAANDKYVFDRLIKGLSSSRASARVGFATTLSEILTNGNDTNDVLELAEQKLPLKGDESAPNAIGQILVCLALIRSAKFGDAASQICNKILAVRKKYKALGTFCIHALIELILAVDKNQFKQGVWPNIKEELSNDQSMKDPNLMWLYLQLSQKFPKFASKIPSLDNDIWLEENLGAVVMHGSNWHPVANSLLNASIKSDEIFERFWSATVQKQLLEPKLDAKKLRRVFEFVTAALEREELTEKQLISICSVQLFKHLLSARLDRSNSNFISDSIFSLIKAITAKVDTKFANDSARLSLLSNCNGCAFAFDSLTGTKLAQHLLGSLSTDGAAQHMRKLTDLLDKSKSGDIGSLEAQQIVQQLKVLFVKCARDSTQLREDILLRLSVWCLPVQCHANASLSNINSHLCSALANCVESLYTVTVSRGQSRVEIARGNLQMLHTILTKMVAQAGSAVDSDNFRLVVDAASDLHDMLDANNPNGTGIAAVMAYCLFWVLVGDAKNEYIEIVQELCSCWKRCKEDQKDDQDEPQWLNVLIELLLQLLSRNDRNLRSVVQVSFSYFVPLMDIEHCDTIIKAIDPSNAEVLSADDEQEMSVDETSDVSESESETENGINEELVNSVRDALGEAADDDSSKESEGDLSDDAMLRLDDTLAAAFRAHVQQRTTRRRDERQKAEEQRKFRMRCLDLFLVLVHSKPNIKLVLKLLPSLLGVADGALKIKSQTSVFEKARHLVTSIISKKTSVVPDISDLCQCFDQLVELSETLSGLSIQSTAGDALAYLLSLAVRMPGEALEEFKTKYSNILHSWMEERTSKVPSSVVMVPIQKHPELMLHMLPDLVAWAFDDNKRVVRKTDACRLCTTYLRRDLVAASKTWKKFFRRFERGIATVVANVNAEHSTENDTCIKPRYLSEVLILAKAVANLATNFKECSEDYSKYFDKVANHLQEWTEAKRWRKAPLNKVASSLLKSTKKSPSSMVSAIVGKLSDRNTSEPVAKKAKVE